MSLTTQLAIGAALFMLGASAFLWRITSAFDRRYAARSDARTER